MALRIYNTLHRKKEEFVPLHEGHVGMYVCGPTVYGHCHIGHGKSYITFDVIVRYLRHLGYKVRYVQNITDVGHLTEDTDEDKILKQSKLENVEPMELVERYTQSYFEDMDAMNVLRPDIAPRASAHIPEQIEMTETLIDEGHAYEANGNVYFSIKTFSDYGKLSGRSTEDQKEGARVEVDPEKKDPQDFLLWRKATKDHILKWRSPWGLGYPGWHLECSVMAMRYIGETLDIHGGGMENQFPHHESEIAQSECCTGAPFVRYWIHNNMVTVNGQKMGKSLGNFVTLKDAFRRHDPRVVRFAILRTHYRSPMDYSEDALHASESGYHRLKTAYEAVKNQKHSSAGVLKADEARRRFLDAMNDDFNTPNALAAAFDFTTEVNTALASRQGDWQAARAFYEDLVCGILGVDFTEKGLAADSLEPGLMDLLIEIRKDLKGKKLFEEADKIRTSLDELGVKLEDTKDGTVWRKSLLIKRL